SSIMEPIMEIQKNALISLDTLSRLELETLQLFFLGRFGDITERDIDEAIKMAVIKENEMLLKIEEEFNIVENDTIDNKQLVEVIKSLHNRCTDLEKFYRTSEEKIKHVRELMREFNFSKDSSAESSDGSSDESSNESNPEFTFYNEEPQTITCPRCK